MQVWNSGPHGARLALLTYELHQPRLYNNLQRLSITSL